MSSETITLTRDAEEWIAIDERTGVEGRGRTRADALAELDEAVARRERTHVVKTPAVLGGKPRIDGTRIGVFTIGESVRENGQSVEDVLEAYPSLSREQVEAALVYYDAHPEAMDVIRTQRAATRQRLERDGGVQPEDTETGT